MAAPTQQEFEAIVRNLMSADNNLRNQAEAMYTNIKNTIPGWLAQALLHLLTTSQDQALRQMCAVILRRAIAKSGPEFFLGLPSDLQTEVKQQLLTLVSGEVHNPVRRSLAFCIAGLGSILCEKGNWNELFPFLFNGVKDGDPGLKKACLSIFSSLVSYLEDTFLIQYLPVLRDAFQFALGEQHPLEVRVAAVDAVASLVGVLEEGEHVKACQGLVGDMLKVIGQALGANAEDKAIEAIESLVTIGEESPELFNTSLPDVFSAMVQIISSEQLEDNVRQIAVEFCLTLCENSARLTKKVPQFVEAFIPIAMKFLTTIQEDKNWAVTQDDEDDMEITFYDVGLESLDRIALALGGRCVEPIVTTLIAQYLSHSGWQYRMAGLMALSQTAEGCSKQFEVNLAAIVGMVLKHLQDEHERVRWAAVHCVAQLSNDFAPGLQNVFSPQILPALMRMLDDSVPRIVAHTANAIVNFMDEADVRFTAPYLDELVTKLLLALQKSQLKFVNEEILAAFASIAENCEQEFVKYYDCIVPYLKQLLAQPPQEKRDRMLRAKAMECISLIGMSVGKQKFEADAKQVMEMLHATLSSKLDPDDPQAQYILQAWARIAKCLGEEFAPYLPHVVPYFLEQASIQTDVTVTDAGDDDEDDEEEGVETLTLAIKGVGDKKIQIKTSLLQDKSLACSVIESFLEDVPKGMTPYVERISQIMVPLLSFAYLGEIRETASRCLPSMLACLPPSVAPADMLRHFVVHLLDAIKLESDVEVAASLVQSLRKCIAACGMNSLPDDLVANCADILKKVFDESIRRRKDVTKQQKEVQDDEDEMEKLEAENEGEEELLNEVTEAVGGMVKKCRSFIPFFANTFYPLCMDLLGPGYGDVEKRLALCAFDDFVEHGSQISAEAVQPYLQQIIAALLKYASSEDPDLAQAAAYGLGVCAQYGGGTFQAAIPEAVLKLVAIAKNPRAADETFTSATANALSSLVKLIKYHQSHESGVCRMEHLVPVILPCLPVSGDEVEAKFVHAEVMDWVLAGSPLVLGENRTNLPAIQALCRKLMDTDLVDDPTKEKMRHIIG